MNPLESLLNNIHASIDAKQAFLRCDHSLQLFERCVVAVLDSYQSGGRLYIAGNGGSAADAQHLAAEFVSKLAHDRAPLPAEALTTDSSILTAIGNDYGFEHIFSRQLIAKLKENDIFLGITTSGRSPNILKALEVCRHKGIQSIVFTAYDGGLVKDLADICIAVPGMRTSTIQELHIVLAHTLCECIESAIFKM